MEVSNEELLEDIFNTEKEMEAYRMISDGFLILSRLPESSGATGYKFKYSVYLGFEIGCKDLLDRLYKIKSERNLE